MIQPAVNNLVVYDEIKLQSLLLTTEVSRLYKAILPDAAEKEFTLPVHLFQIIKDGIYKTMRVASPRDVLGRVTTLVRESLEVCEQEERLSADTLKPRGGFDLCDVDLTALNTNLRTGHRNIKAEQMRYLLYERIRRMIQVNPSRVKLMEKLDRAVSKYNEGCANLASDPALVNPQEKITRHPAAAAIEQEQLQDEYINALVELTGDVVREDQRHDQEEVSEEELAIFDILTLDVTLSAEEHPHVKEVARAILAALHPTFNILDWQKKPLTLGRVSTIIDDELLRLPPQIYSQELCQQKHDALFLYVLEHYKNDGSISVAG